MLMKFIKFSGYLLYTFAVLLFLLWYEFPADAVKIRVERDLNSMTPALRWNIGRITFLPPAAVQLNDIRINGKVTKELLFTINALSLRPNLLLWKKTGELSARYRVGMLDGTVSGQVRSAKNRTGIQNIQYSGDIKEIKLDNDGLGKLFQEYDRTVSGMLSGNFTGAGNIPSKLLHTAQGQLRLNKGIISLQESILGMEQLVFEQISGKIRYDSGKLHLEEGKMKSRSLNAEFSGSLQPASPFSLSRIQSEGSLLPRPEFLASFGSPKVVELLKRQLRDGGLPFTINGILREPGIVFTGLPADFNKKPQQEAR
jgi:type II secretion system protein N